MTFKSILPKFPAQQRGWYKDDYLKQAHIWVAVAAISAFCAGGLNGYASHQIGKFRRRWPCCIIELQWTKWALTIKAYVAITHSPCGIPSLVIRLRARQVTYDSDRCPSQERAFRLPPNSVLIR